MWDILRGRGLSPTEVRDWMRSAEPFRTEWPRTAKLIEDIENVCRRSSMTDRERLQIMVQGLLAQELPTQEKIREVIAETRPACR